MDAGGRPLHGRELIQGLEYCQHTNRENPGQSGNFPNLTPKAWPNNAVERTGHSVRFLSGASRCTVARRSPRALGVGM